LILLRNATLFSPLAQGRQDILVAGGRFVCIEPEISGPNWPGIQVLDLEERWVIPGLVDSHIHIAGAGGEGGPMTRTGPIPVSSILDGGITTVIGCLGTDGITRGVESVLMQAKALRQAGLSAWIYTGAYQVPPPTIMGNVARDLALIDEVIGVGEIALADHRSSFPNERELTQLVLQTGLGAMLGQKSGVVNVHLGDQPDPFALLQKVSGQNGVNRRRFLPTHCNRSRRVLDDAAQWGLEGFVDLTASSYPFYPDLEIKPSLAVMELVDRGVPFNHIAISSDAGGSLPQFDVHGNLIKNAMGHPVSLFREAIDLAEAAAGSDIVPFAVVTSTPADILGLRNKGRIRKGNDADLVVIDKERRGIHAVMAGGRWMYGPVKNDGTA